MKLAINQFTFQNPKCLKNFDPNYNTTNANYQLVVLYGLKAMMKDPLKVAKLWSEEKP